MNLEDALIKKSRPKWNSKRWQLLREASGFASGRCERCKRMLFNPQSILIHQGRGCQAKINKL